jgi:hypothetical protein
MVQIIIILIVLAIALPLLLQAFVALWFLLGMAYQSLILPVWNFGVWVVAGLIYYGVPIAHWFFPCAAIALGGMYFFKWLGKKKH